jgi:hypothetical protein
MKQLKDSKETFESLTEQVWINQDNIANIPVPEINTKRDKPDKEQCSYICKDTLGGGKNCLVDECFDPRSNDVPCEDKICRIKSGTWKLNFFGLFFYLFFNYITNVVIILLQVLLLSKKMQKMSHFFLRS